MRRPGQDKLTFTQMMAAGTAAGVHREASPRTRAHTHSRGITRGRSFAGLFQAVICYPLETVRGRLAVGTVFGTSCNLRPMQRSRAERTVAPEHKYRGIFDCVADIFRTEGPLSL